jgi:hypothetical protein
MAIATAVIEIPSLPFMASPVLSTITETGGSDEPSLLPGSFKYFAASSRNNARHAV